MAFSPPRPVQLQPFGAEHLRRDPSVARPARLGQRCRCSPGLQCPLPPTGSIRPAALRSPLRSSPHPGPLCFFGLAWLGGGGATEQRSPPPRGSDCRRGQSCVREGRGEKVVFQIPPPSLPPPDHCERIARPAGSPRTGRFFWEGPPVPTWASKPHACDWQARSPSCASAGEKRNFWLIKIGVMLSSTRPVGEMREPLGRKNWGKCSSGPEFGFYCRRHQQQALRKASSALQLSQ